MNRNVLVVGAGYWGKKVISEYCKLLDTKFLDNVYVFDTDKRLLDFSDKRVKAIANIDDLIKNVNFAHICTPNATHFKLAERFLTSGIATLVEKPLTEALDEAERLVKIADSNSVPLRVGMVYRYSESVAKAKESLGYSVGRAELINATWLHNIDTPNIQRVMKDRDVVWDVFIHLLDVIGYLFDSFPSFSYAEGRSGGNKYNHSFNAFGNLGTSMVSIRSTFISHRKERRIEIIGSKGNLEIDLLNNRISFGNDEDFRTINFYDNPLLSEIKDFIDSKQHDDKRSSGRIGYDEVKLISHLLDLSEKNRINRGDPL
ncbi:MAG: Gfo/Idh/MocA family oxidoreductase [Candidatus Parvarchaeota archaeon]